MKIYLIAEEPEEEWLADILESEGHDVAIATAVIDATFDDWLSLEITDIKLAEAIYITEKAWEQRKTNLTVTYALVAAWGLVKKVFCEDKEVMIKSQKDYITLELQLLIQTTQVTHKLPAF